MIKTVFDKDLSGTYLFISFDLVNSTAFKLQDRKWPPLFNQFFDYCRLKTKNYFPNCKNWKMVGDEILFYMPVINNNDLLEAPFKIFSIMNECINYLDKQADTKGVLSVKSVVWSAYITDQQQYNLENNGRNYLIKSVSGGGVKLDFLGPDIDTGFRIGSFSMAGKLVVGASLSALIYILDSKTEITDKLRIVSYELLKGVWSGRRYPVVWYHDSWNNPDEMFLYDERFSSELVSRIITDNTAEKCNLHLISKVFKDLNKENELDELLLGIDEQKQNINELSEIESVGLERLSEVHLVAMCFNEKGELLIGERIENNSTIWDFGCSSLSIYHDIEDSLEQGYLDDFGLSLEKIDGEYPPISTYSYFTGGEKRTIPGVMFLAKVTDEAQTSMKLNSITYKSFKWIAQDNIGEVDSTSTVSEFHNSARKAFKAYKREKK